jgi:hypothetical protein
MGVCSIRSVVLRILRESIGRALKEAGQSDEQRIDFDRLEHGRLDQQRRRSSRNQRSIPFNRELDCIAIAELAIDLAIDLAMRGLSISRSLGIHSHRHPWLGRLAAVRNAGTLS